MERRGREVKGVGELNAKPIKSLGLHYTMIQF